MEDGHGRSQHQNSLTLRSASRRPVIYLWWMAMMPCPCPSSCGHVLSCLFYWISMPRRTLGLGRAKQMAFLSWTTGPWAFLNGSWIMNHYVIWYMYIYRYDKYVFFLSCLHLHPSIHSQGVRCHILHPIPKCHLHRQCCPRTKQGFGLASRATNSLPQLCTRSLRILRRIWCGIARLQIVFRNKSANVAFVGSIMRFGSIGAFVGTICSVNVPKHPVASASLVILSGTKPPRPGNAKLELYVV